MDEQNKNFTTEDIEKNKVIAALAYLIFFLPLIAAKDSAFGKFHANQGLLLLIAWIVVSFIGSFVAAIIPVIGSMVYLVLYVGMIVVTVLAIMKTANGKAEELPLIGNINLINK